MNELEILQNKYRQELRGLVYFWRCSLPERFPETMLPEDIQNLVVEVVGGAGVVAPTIYYHEGRRFLDREEWLSWFETNILSRFDIDR